MIINQDAEDRWDRIYFALQDVEITNYLREEGFIDDSGVTEKGEGLKRRIENIYKIIEGEE